MKSDELQNHIFATYLTLRRGVAIIGIAFPFLLWAGGAFQGISFQDSMSAYYHATAGDHSMRNWFVGLLFAVGALVYLYKGYSVKENYALNFAGLFAIGVAIFPMAWPKAPGVSLHGICAISFFVCIAYVCIFRASDTLHLLKDPVREARFRRLYRRIGFGMILFPVIALLMTVVFQRFSAYAFFAEASGIWIFATYWLVKSRELKTTNAEQLALNDQIQI